MLFFSCLSITSAFITHAGAMASRSAVLSLAEAGISPQVGAPPADVLDPSFAPSERDGLLVIDVQTDFMPGGALEVPGGTEVIPIVNALVRRFEHVVLSQDWHPPKHSSFASQHEGKSPYDETQMPYGAQTLWPDHCVQNTPGSAFHADWPSPRRAHLPQGLPVGHRLVQRVLRERPGHGDGAPGTLPGAGRHGGIRGRGGVDFCVRFSCEDAAARCGATAVLVKDATRAVGLPGSVEAAAKGLEQAGVRVVNAAELRS